MKIAVIVPGGVDRSGERRVIPALLWLFERIAREHDVHVFALYQDAEPSRYTLLGATVHSAGRPGSRRRTFRNLWREHRDRRFDVLHAFWATPPGVIAAVASRLLRVPALLHLAGGELVALPEIGYGARRHWRGRLWVKLALRGAARVTAASRDMVERAAALGVCADELPLGVDAIRWPRRAPAPRPGDRPPRLLHVASLNAVKDQDTLLRAAAMLTQRHVPFQLDVVGEDTLGGALHRTARALGLEELVTFHGYLVQRELRPLVERADVLVMSSRHEAGPLVMLEAAVAGVPTVGTAVGHVRDWAPDAAVAVPVGDADALACAVAELLDDEPRRLRVARAAQERALSRDADWTARRVLGIYDEMTTGRAGRRPHRSET